MLNYIIRRFLYAIPIVFGVMLITFLLFYVAQSPHAMAKRVLGEKAPEEAIQTWLHNRGYDKPRLINTQAGHNPFDSQFFNHLRSLALFDLGVSDTTGEPIWDSFKRGAIPSLLITFPAFLLGLFLEVSIALYLVFVRESRVDTLGTIICVGLMSFPIMVYTIFGQWLIALKLNYLPVFGFNYAGFSTLKYLLLPVAIAVIADLGAGVRLYRAIFIEEIHQDYVRTALAKGVANSRALFVHVLKNGMISLITLLVAALPFLIMGTLVLESFFGIPGLGNLTITAIREANFSVVRAAVYLSALFYLFGLLMTDICYALADPRIRLR